MSWIITVHTLCSTNVGIYHSYEDHPSSYIMTIARRYPGIASPPRTFIVRQDVQIPSIQRSDFALGRSEASYPFCRSC
jgi:hypothetical protein